MCSVSMVTDNWSRKGGWPLMLPNVIEYATKAELAALRRELEELKAELKKARAKDIEENAPDCKMKESVELVRELAEKLGVDLEDVFDGHK